ncbi:DUF397 domain-containing protein [Streptomyces sp. NPDC020490]|uniref:DUF397 domain-containing protein n=1 Tax=Streptomyces sp. NPDC020490 TaxID=3365078 RepID=UPI0037B24364
MAGAARARGAGGADGLPGAVGPVRDSKVPHGPALCFDTASWAAFTSELKTGRHRP